MKLTEIHHRSVVDSGSPRTGVRTGYLSKFRSLTPRFQSLQADLLDWLIDAHARSGNVDRSLIEASFKRYSASSDHILSRGHELADFTHRRWEEMDLFGPHGSDLEEKTRFFSSRVYDLFEKFYSGTASPPGAIVHVTCTGYDSPSGAQRLVAHRGWGRSTEVVHAYHMGCYAAHPAIRMASGYARALQTVDIAHTELCSLHLDPSRHDPEHIVIQSLFADGFIQYQLSEETPDRASLKILAARDEVLPDSSGAMAWSTGPLHFLMHLSKDVPVLLASALPRFVKSLFEEAGFDWTEEKEKAIFAIHPGGPRIIELSEKVLEISPLQARHSRDVLRKHGNMSSATLPHIWKEILSDPQVPNETVIASIGAGPGLTLSGMILRKTGDSPKGALRSSIGTVPDVAF